MIEEHVIKLAELQAEVDKELIGADFASANVGSRITEAEETLLKLERERDLNRRPYIEAAEELKTTIGDLYATIIDEWSDEHKTMVFGDRVLKFTQRGSLKIHDEVWLLEDMTDRMSIEDIFAKKYLKGFNLTAVKKYLGVHDLPIDVAVIEYKTTVKLE